LTSIENEDLTDISTLYIEKENCWLGHFDKSKFYCYNLKSKSLTSYQLDEDSKDGVSSPVMAICRMNDSLIWAGSYVDKGTIQNAGGVSIINTRTKSVQRIYSDRLNRSSCLSNAYVEHLFRDKQGSMWVVGTDGIDFYHPTMSAFTIYKPDFIPGDYLIPPSGIVDIDADQDGNVWIASKSDGLVKISKEGKVIQSVSLMNSRFRQDGFVFGMIACAKNEVLYIAGTNEILSVDTKEKSGFTSGFKVRKSGVSGITRMVVDNQNNLWVATHHDGVYKLGVDGQEEHFGNEEDEMHLIPTNEVLGLSVNGDTILACLGYEGLYLFQSGKKPNPVYSAKALAAKGWTKCKLRDVRMNSNWIVFSTKDQGVRYLNRKTQVLSQLNEDNGLFQNGVSGIEIDKHGIFWIADVEGLTRFDANTNSIESFSAKRSLPETGFYNGAHAVNALGIIYFSNHTHLISIDPDRNTVKDIGLNLTITGFKVNDKELSLNEQNDVYQFEYDENNITINFTSLNFINPLDDEYFYKLEGFTNEWRPVPANRFLSFTNLPQGNYKLLLRVKNLNSSISDTGISFYIATAYYKTWWFISLIILLISGLLYWAYRYRLSQILKLQSLRTEISNDLHDDIGSTLSSVYYSAELLKLQGEQQTELRKRIIDNISTNTRELVDRMRDIVWSIHVDQNETESLAIRIREYINRFDLPEGIQLVFNGNINQFKGVELNMRVRRNVFLVFKEALNNAIKHSEATKIAVDLSIANHEMELQVVDNGKGIASSLTSEGNGLRTMKERMAEVGGKLTIHTMDGDGTKIRLVVPLGR
jgi:two-component sensor histidine kinase/streptogramin lyase